MSVTQQLLHLSFLAESKKYKRFSESCRIPYQFYLKQRQRQIWIDSTSGDFCCCQNQKGYETIIIAIKMFNLELMNVYFLADVTIALEEPVSLHEEESQTSFCSNVK